MKTAAFRARDGGNEGGDGGRRGGGGDWRMERVGWAFVLFVAVAVDVVG